MSLGVAVLQGFAEKKLHLGPTSDPNHQVNYENTVEPPVSDYPRCEDLVVAYFNRTTGCLFREDVRIHLLYGNSLLHMCRSVQCHVVTKVLRIFLSDKVHTANMEIRLYVK